MQYHVEGRGNHIFSVILLYSVCHPPPPFHYTVLLLGQTNFCEPTMTCRMLHGQGLGWVLCYSFLMWIHVVQL